MEKRDAIIFDMDGTLWDATDSYVECWNISAKYRCGHVELHCKSGQTKLESVMGWDERKAMSFCFLGL